MKFGIFVFGDNPPEIGRSNQKYYEEVLTMAEWAEELGFDSFWLGEHHFYWYGTCVSPPMVIAALGQRTKKIRLGPAISVPAISQSAYRGRGVCLGRQPLRWAAGFRYRQRLLAGGIQDVRHVDGGSEEKGIGKQRDIILKAWRQEEFSHQGKYYHIRQCFLIDETAAKTDAADLDRRLQRRDLDQGGRTGTSP